MFLRGPSKRIPRAQACMVLVVFVYMMCCSNTCR
jgi:hypothetical protein